MKQAIAGVAPAEVREATVMTVWPSNAAYPLGQKLGRWFALAWPDLQILRVGNLLALLTIPVSVALYFLKVLPRTAMRYRLTNRRVVVETGMGASEARSIGLGDFDAIVVEVLDGQQWYHAGNLLFQRAGETIFRWDGIARPEPVRHTCEKARMAWVGVHRATDAA